MAVGSYICFRFRKQYQNLSAERRDKFDKQLDFLLANLRHPSLRAKEYDETNDIWQARVDDGYRFTVKLMKRSPASGVRWKSQICVMKAMRLSIVQEEIARTISTKAA
ncbi:MAG: hypothetical protein ABI955_06765 [Nitrospirota bacterium]